MNQLITYTVLILCVAMVVQYLPLMLKRNPYSKDQGGFAAPGWRKVADIFIKHLDNGWQKGGAVAVYYKGELVVEFAGGMADDDAFWGWSKDTLSMFMSTTKVVSAIVMGLLVDRGLLDYSAPVSKYWPEFAQNGKDKVTVEQLFSHQGAVASIDEKFSYFDLVNNEENLVKLLEIQEPNWDIGDGVGYHGTTVGLYMDQLVKRVDPQHRSLSQFFQDEIAKPFDIDFFIGLPKEENYRCARSYMFSLMTTDLFRAKRYWPCIWKYATDSSSLIAKTTSNPKELEDDGIENNPSYREIPAPSTHGFGTAIGLAKLLGILANGGIHEGQRLLSESVINQINEPIASGKDKTLLMDMTYGRGVTLRKSPKGNTIFGAPGSGGQMGYCDPENQLGWAYVTNHMSLFAIGDDPKYLELEKAIYESLQHLEESRREN